MRGLIAGVGNRQPIPLTSVISLTNGNHTTPLASYLVYGGSVIGSAYSLQSHSLCCESVVDVIVGIYVVTGC